MRILVFLMLALLVSGCTSPQHADGRRSIRVLEAEHGHRDIVVVKLHPAPARRCWKHARHWHCRRS